jgi:hypothetical protein
VGVFVSLFTDARLQIFLSTKKPVWESFSPQRTAAAVTAPLHFKKK